MNERFDVTQLALLGEAVDCLDEVSVFVWDDDRNYVAVNKAACELLDLTREKILAMHVGDLHPDRATELFEAVQQRGTHTGVMETPRGALHYLTCRTKIAGLPYMVSICWRAS